MAAALVKGIEPLSLKKCADECYGAGIAFHEKYTQFHAVHGEARGVINELEVQVISFVRANSVLDRDLFEAQIAESYSAKTAKKIRALLKKVPIETQLPKLPIEMPGVLRDAARNYSRLYEVLETDEAYQAYRTAKKAFKKVVVHYLNMGIGCRGITGYIKRTASEAGVDSSAMVRKIFDWDIKRVRPLSDRVFAV